MEIPCFFFKFKKYKPSLNHQIRKRAANLSNCLIKNTSRKTYSIKVLHDSHQLTYFNRNIFVTLL